MAQLEPTTKAFIDQLNQFGIKPLYEMSIPEARNFLEELQKSYQVDLLSALIEDLEITYGGFTISLRMVRPFKALDEEVLPVIMYFHGGGWILGSKNTHDRLIRQIANGTGAAVIFVDYTRSPEADYPVAIEQGYAATKYIADYGDQLNLDGSRLAVAGDSVGGNMATVIALLAQQRGGPPIRYQVLFYPVTDANFYNESYQRF